MKKFMLFILISLLIIGCGANNNKASKDSMGKQAGIANTENGTQPNKVTLEKENNSKVMAKPSSIKAAFEGDWVAQVRDASYTFAEVARIKKVYDKNNKKKYWEIITRFIRYEGNYDKNRKNVLVFKWKPYPYTQERRLELNNKNENLNTFKIRYENLRRDETWTYIADSDTIQEKHVGLDGSIQTTIFKRYSSKELQRIKQRSKEVILGLYKTTKVEID